MNKRLKDTVAKVAESVGWAVSFDDDRLTCEFTKETNITERDYDFEVSTKHTDLCDFAEEVYKIWEDFDYCEETEEWVRAKADGDMEGIPDVETLLNYNRYIDGAIAELYHALVARYNGAPSRATATTKDLVEWCQEYIDMIKHRVMKVITDKGQTASPDYMRVAIAGICGEELSRSFYAGMVLEKAIAWKQHYDLCGDF